MDDGHFKGISSFQLLHFRPRMISHPRKCCLGIFKNEIFPVRHHMTTDISVKVSRNNQGLLRLPQKKKGYKRVALKILSQPVLLGLVIDAVLFLDGYLFVLVIMLRCLQLLLVMVVVVQAAPRTRMVMKIRPLSKSLDLPIHTNTSYTHVDVEDPEVQTLAKFAATALSFSSDIKETEPLNLVRITSALKRIDSEVDTKYKLTVVLRGSEKHSYYCNAVVSEEITNWTKGSSHREVHLIQPSRCITGPEELILAGQDVSQSLPAALFAASELSQSIFVLNASLTSMQSVAEWMPTEKYFGTEYTLNLIYSTKDSMELDCHAIVNDRISHSDKQMVTVDCMTTTPVNGSVERNDSVEQPDIKTMSEFVTNFLRESRNLDINLIHVASAERKHFEGIQIRPSLQLLSHPDQGEEDLIYYCNAAVFQDGRTGDFELMRTHTTCTNTPPTVVTADNLPKTDENESSEVNADYQDVPINDRQAAQMAAFATSAVSHIMDFGDLSLNRIQSAQRQAVRGKAINHRFLLDLKSSTGDLLVCMAVIFDEPSTNTRELNEAHCRPGDSDPEIPSTGSFEDFSVNDAQVVELANFATPIVSRSMNLGDLVLINVETAERQNVADGVDNHRLHLNLETSTSDMALHCMVVIADHETREVTELRCRPGELQQQRAIAPVAPVAPVVPVEKEETPVAPVAPFSNQFQLMMKWSNRWPTSPLWPFHAV